MILSFRIWDKIDKEIIHVDGIDFEQKTVRTADVIVPFAECVLMQSTGLFDKNGVEIFEGDVVIFLSDLRDVYVCKPSNFESALVAYNPKGRFEIAFLALENEDWEVIGNIHENPELIPHA